MIDKKNKNSYRRSYSRFKANGAANVMLDGALDKPLIIRDLSSRGAGVMADMPFAINKGIEISIVAPILSATVTKCAKVVWCQKIDSEFYAVGLDFGIHNILEFS